MILVARRQDRLAELRDELQEQHPNLAVQIRQVDLADPAQLQELMEWFDRENINVDLLINNAGLGDSGPFATSDPIRNEQMTLVNVVALTLTHSPRPPQMIAKRRGSILNIQFVGWLPSGAWFCRLCCYQGLRYEFL
jgi:short-subunit dehydrogenase